MNFMEAVKAMREGKKVRRKNWITPVDLDWIRVPNYCIVANRPTFDLSTIDYEATDWEIHEEKDTWNLADCEQVAMNRQIDHRLVSDIKTFIQKVQEDMDCLLGNDDIGNWKTLTHSGGFIHRYFNEIIDKRVGGIK